MNNCISQQSNSNRPQNNACQEECTCSDASGSVEAAHEVADKEACDSSSGLEAQITGQKDEGDSNLVDWATDDPEKPLNWSTSAKCLNLGLVSFFRFLTPLASSMVAPVTGLILRDFDTDNETIGSFIVSVFILGYALGPLVLSPLSELYGRLPLYHVNNALFTLWNLGAALSPNVGALLAFRLLAGLAGSCPVTIGNVSIADTVARERRGLVTTIFTCGPLLGPVLGPIAGGYLGEAAGWRWIFWVLSIASGLSTLISLIVQRETYEPVLLERRIKHLRKTLNSPELYHRYSHKTINRAYFAQSILRPLKMLIFSPIVLITSIYVGLVYGYTYLLFTSFTPLYETVYNFTPSRTGLTYLGFGGGCTIGLVIFGALSDASAKARTAASASGEWKPEYRLPPLLPGSLLVPIGLFWYGWSAQAHVHWIMPIVGTAWVGLGTLAIFMPVQTYLIDAFEGHAASASAANTVLRSLLGAFLPLAGPGLYAALGQGWGNSLLGFVALGFTPLAWVIYRFGERIRVAYPVEF